MLIGIGHWEMILVLVIVVLPVWALLKLRSRQLEGLALVLWVIAIIAIPLFGPLAFFIVSPKHNNARETHQED